MDKGIRPFVNALFVEKLPQRAELGNTGFRKTVIADTMAAFGCTLASAATHYNHAFKLVKGTNPELVVGLGRPEDKKGGRKKKVTIVEAAPAATPQGEAASPANSEAPAPVEAATPQGEGELDPDTQAVQEMLDSTDVKWPHTKVTVRRKSDGTVIGEFTIPEAEALVAKAKAAKKAALTYETPAEAAQ
jgi:hypothetical protein